MDDRITSKGGNIKVGIRRTQHVVGFCFEKNNISPHVTENIGLRRGKHSTVTTCQQGKVKEVYFNSKSGHSIVCATVNFWKQ